MHCSFVLPMSPPSLNRCIYIYVPKRNRFSRRKHSFSHMYAPAPGLSWRGIPVQGIQPSGMLVEALAEARCVLCEGFDSHRCNGGYIFFAGSDTVNLFYR